MDRKSGGMYRGVKIPVKYLDRIIIGGVAILAVLFIITLIK